MISDVDDDGSGTFEYEEFLNMLSHKIFNRDPKDEILKAFRLFDECRSRKSRRPLNSSIPMALLPLAPRS